MRYKAIIVGLVAMAAIPMTSAAAATSQAAKVHYGGRSPSLRAALLTTDDLESLPDAPLGLGVGAVNDTSGVYRDPDPRLPCGRKAPTISTSQAVGEQVHIADGFGFEGVVSEPKIKAESLIRLYEGDVRIGCSYKSSTNTGGTQTNTLVARIPMPKVDAQALGLVVVVRSDNQTLGAYEMTMRSQSLIASVLLFSSSPLEPQFVLALARTAEMRLAGQLRT